MAGLNLGLIVHVQVSGNVSGLDQNGGLVGVNRGTIQQSSSKGTVSGVNGIGGLVGQNLGQFDAALIENSYSNASVTASGLFNGGLIGAIEQSTTQNCYSTGSVSGADFIGGLIGFDNGNGAVVIDSFWDTQTSGQTSSGGGIGKTTSEMMMQTTFDPPWDFTNIWTIDEGNDYPRLRTPVLICSFDCQCDDDKECTTDTCNAGSCVNDSVALEGSACTQVNQLDSVCTDGVCTGDPIPTVSEWGLIAMSLMLLTGGTVLLRNHKATVSS